MKVTVYIENVFHDEKEITDPKEIARIVKNHISHLGKVEVYYEIPYNMLPWWKQILRAMAGR